MMAASMALPGSIKKSTPLGSPRVALSLLLAAYFAFAVLAPLAAGDDAGLPQCCRRHGAHHCSMMMLAGERAIGPGWRQAPCPLWPHNATIANLQTFVAPRFGIAGSAFAAVAGVAQLRVRHSLLPRERQLGLRGPPARFC